MKIYRLPQLADSNPEGNYLLGREDLKTVSAYILYARMRPKESDRSLSTREGCEEIIYIVKGSLNVRHGRSAFTVNAGEAFLANDKLLADNPNDEEAVYIAAGNSLAGSILAGRGLQAQEPCAVPEGLHPRQGLHPRHPATQPQGLHPRQGPHPRRQKKRIWMTSK